MSPAVIAFMLRRGCVTPITTGFGRIHTQQCRRSTDGVGYRPNNDSGGMYRRGRNAGSGRPTRPGVTDNFVSMGNIFSLIECRGNGPMGNPLARHSFAIIATILRASIRSTYFLVTQKQTWRMRPRKVGCRVTGGVSEGQSTQKHCCPKSKFLQSAEGGNAEKAAKTCRVLLALVTQQFLPWCAGRIGGTSSTFVSLYTREML